MQSKKKRTYNVRRICLTQSYSVQEVAELFGIHKNSVLQWKKSGLPVIDDKKPFLFYGGDLAEFLRKRQSSRKHKCQPNEFYCCKCRKPRTPWANLVDVEFKNSKKILLKALCSVCETSIQRMGATKKLSEYRKTFSIQTKQEEHIIASSLPSANCDKEKERKNE